MGLGLFRGCSITSNVDTEEIKQQYKRDLSIIYKWRRRGDYLIVQIFYKKATNYKGHKLLVYEGVDISELRKAEFIDPHFSENISDISPIARFEPTERGWRMAESLCTICIEKSI